MRYLIIAIAGLFLFTAFTFDSMDVNDSYNIESELQQIADNNKKFTDAVRKKIEGKENSPGGEVFEDIQIELFKSMPASRILAIMNRGFAQSLGVDCTHCHNTEKFESNEKEPKDIARKMWVMRSEVQKLAREASGNPEAIVNCTVCHSGSIIPGKPNPKK